MHERRIGAKNEFSVVTEGAAYELILHLHQRWVGREGRQQSVDICGDDGPPLRRVGGNLLISLALANLIAGEPHLTTGEFGEDGPGRHDLPDQDIDRGHNAVDRCEVVDLLAGVIVEPPGHGEFVLKRLRCHRGEADRYVLGNGHDLGGTG